MPPAPAAPVDIAALVSVAAEQNPDKRALVEAGGRSLTWHELDGEVSRVATGLGTAGIVAGYRVVIAVGNRIEFVTAYLGALRAQVVAVPVNPRAFADEVARIVVDCGARMVVADAETVASVRAAARLWSESGSTPRVVVVGADPLPGELSYDRLRSGPARLLPVLQDPERLAALLYTSGTSGEPRAAMLSHRALAANVEQIAAVSPPMISGDDVVLGVLPLSHVYGLNAVLGSVIRHRAKLVLLDRFDAEGTLDLIEDEACSVVPVAPPVFAQWRGLEGVADRLGPVRLMLSGSAPIAPEVVAEFTARTGIAVHQGYGLTETAPVLTSTLRSATMRPGSVGAALEGVELRLVDEAGRVATGEDPGEIHVRGANLFSGYWPDGAGGPDAEGWWATGDVGFLDASGDVFLVDRVKELVIVSGFNVYPVEVEDVIGEVPDVTAVGVIGTPDPETGEAVIAYVVASGDPAAVAGIVGTHCEARLARFKVPARIEVVDRLPLSVTGKVQKGQLRHLDRQADRRNFPEILG